MLSVVKSLKLLAEVSGDPAIFEKAMHRMSFPEIYPAFSMDSIYDSNLLLVPRNVSTEEIAA